MRTVSTNPPSGFRDFLPGEAAARLELVTLITQIYQAHGFQPIGMPMLENLSTLQGKGGGGENEKLIFKVAKRGEQLTLSFMELFQTLRDQALRSGEGDIAVDHSARPLLASGKPLPLDDLADLGLRFDLTLPLARYCARFREQLPKPFKVFQIGPVWRADRPQKGRFREFFQCDVDIVGAREIGAEVDCIAAILEVFQGVGMDGVEVHLNDRQMLAALGKSLNVNDGSWAKCLVSLDKLDKMPPEKVAVEVLAHLQGDFADPQGIAARIIDAFTGKVDKTFYQAIHAESYASLHTIIDSLAPVFPDVKIVFNPTLVRGQDYYTGTIFEIRHPNLSGSLGGGGRYNRLLEVFGSPETPAFGGSIGFERLVMLLQEKSPEQATAAGAPDIFFPLLDPSLRGHVNHLAMGLRKHGLAVDVFPDAAKLKQQFKYADDRKIPYTAIVGNDEKAAEQVKIKVMATGSESSYPVQPLEAFFEAMVKLCRR